MKLTFLGANGTVTGSRYLVEFGGRRVLIDCGLFQGLKQLRLRNWAPLPVDPSTIDAVVLTHAHIDHSGYLPRLVEEGFRGVVHATQATTELCALLLPDSGHLQEEEAAFANRHGTSRHAPALPLYTEAQARACLPKFRSHDFGASFEPVPGVFVRFHAAGHILGAASVHLVTEAGSVLFSGDLGRSDDLLMKPPAAPTSADVVLVESTYGNRLHERSDTLAALADVVNRTVHRGGHVIVPAFAVGRAQLLLHALRLLKDDGRIPDLPVYLDSPMATNATALYQRHVGQHRLDAEACAAMSRDVHVVNTADDSRALASLRFPAVIISASGMATGGRVVHHIENFAPGPANTILFVGYQAMGTRGAALLGGAREIRMHGRWIPVRAEVVSLEGLSSHADREELVAWLAGMATPPRHVYVTHGDPEAADSLRQLVSERFGWRCDVPEYRDCVDFGAQEEAEQGPKRA
ncbi:MAG: MBL fold metallo-hydrolase RNA specificity domain-containing protein [Vitreoscilla sp.]|jgi:metallo-beta-lactamase family protein